jgi:RNA polymerase sigma-70 factor (ECF subfamily)
MSSSDAVPPFVEFPQTEWSCIEKVGNRSNPEYVSAVNRFIGRYWKPVFYFLRARGIHFADAQDLTQEFLWWFVERDRADCAGPQRGRFRDFLRTLLVHFLSDQGPRAPRQVRFERSFVLIQDLVGPDELAFEPAAGETPEEIYDRKWAARIWTTAHWQLHEHYAGEGRKDWYTIFMDYCAPQGQRPGQEALAAQHGLSRDQVRDIVGKAKKRLERLLRAELREEGLTEQEIDDEMHGLSAKLLIMPNE